MNLRRKVSVLLCSMATTVSMCLPSAYANLNGFDVSSWQTPATVCQASGDFVIIKASGGNWYTNPNMKAQAACAEQTGKRLGFYHYASEGTTSNPAVEAEFFINTIKPYVGRSVLALDWEPGGNMVWGNGSWIRQFVNRIHELTGVWPLVYVSAGFISQIPQDVLGNCGLWVAQYADNTPTGYQPTPWLIGRYGEAMRQYSSNGVVGASQRLDLNLFRGDTAAFDKYAQAKYIPPQQQPKPTPVATPQPATFSVVIRPGDTMWSIALRSSKLPLSFWRVPSGNLNIIYPGQVAYYVPNDGVTPNVDRMYIVKSGDTLGSIAARLGISWRSLRGYRSGNPNLIYVGEHLSW